MPLKIKELRLEEAIDVIDENSDELEITDPFHTVGWFKSIGSSKLGELKFLILYDDNTIASIFPLFYRRFFGFKILLRPPATPYFGPIYKKPATTKLSRVTHRRQEYTKALSRYVGRRFYGGEIFLSPEFYDLREFTWNGWDSSVRFTIINRIDDVDYLWKELKSKVRNKIRGVNNNEYRVEISDEIEPLMEMMAKTYEWQNKSDPLNEEFYTGLRENIIKRDAGKIYYLVHPDEGVLSARVVLIYEYRAYDLLAGSDRTEGVFNYDLNVYFIWKIFEDLSETVKYFDFTGANMRSIAHFKSNFEGELTPFFQVSLNRNFTDILTHLVNIFHR